MQDLIGTAEPSVAELNSSASKGTILIAEDVAPLRQFLSRAVEEQGYTVLRACDGEDALSQARCHESAIQVLVTDIEMPNLDGVELAAAIRKLHPSVGVVFMSGAARRDLPPTSGNTGFLGKPFTAKALFEAVRKVQRAGGIAAPPAAPPR